MTKYEKALRYHNENRAVLQKHYKNGGDFAQEALEATEVAIEAIKKQVPRAALCAKCPDCGEFVDRELNYCDCGQAINWQITDCIQITCPYCGLSDINGIVCPYYAAKTDEIRRIHEEG